jgi:hypothetical protein
MPTSTITSKRQTTVPRGISAKLTAGTKLEWTRVSDTEFTVRVQTNDLLALAGCLTKKTKVRGVTVAQMNETITKAGSR